MDGKTEAAGIVNIKYLFYLRRDSCSLVILVTKGDILISVITTILYGTLAAIVVGMMKYETNRRLQDYHDLHIGDTCVRPYRFSVMTCISIAVLIALSGLCGFIVSKHAISIIAIIEIGMCYLAVLGAAIIDLKTKTIPNYIPFMLIGIRLIIFLFEVFYFDSALSGLASSLIGCFLCVLLLIIANKFSKGGIGAGDIKLLSGVGFMCGVYVVFSTLLIALICCLVVTVILLALKKQTAKGHLPFGPFIYMGYAIMCLLTLY